MSARLVFLLILVTCAFGQNLNFPINYKNPIFDLNNVTLPLSIDFLLSQINISSIILPILESLSENNSCSNQLILFLDGLGIGDKWAWWMLDASAKPQAGFLYGNTMHVGNHDECIEINENVKNEKVQGKYCTARYRPHPTYGANLSFPDIDEDDFIISNTISYGFCVPKACSSQNLQSLFNSIEETLKLPIHFKFVDQFCVAEEKKPFTTSAIIAITIFSFFGIITILSTIYDYFIHQKSKNQTPNLYVAFSLLSNGKRIFSTKTNEGSLGCLNGLRVISLMWIILGHRFTVTLFIPKINFAQFHELISNFETAAIAASPMAVDTFFFIGALLLVYLYMKNEDKKIKFSLPMFYLHRFLRLTPSLAMILLFIACIEQYLRKGPFFVVLEEMGIKPCQEHWWATLFYLQNYVHSDDMCLGTAWYLAVDTQMYILSPLILIPLTKWPKIITSAIVFYSVLIAAYVFEISYKQKLGVTYLEYNQNSMDILYYPTHIRARTYVLGMLAGYYFYKNSHKKPKLSQFQVLFLWALSLLMLLTIVLSTKRFLDGDYQYWESSLHHMLSKPLWCLGIFIVMFLCINGYGGFINYMLSHKIFTILIRLNYNIYLLHNPIQQLLLSREMTPQYFQHIIAYHNFWGDYMFSLVVAIFWTLLFESPVIVLEKIIFGPKIKPVTNSTKNENIINGKEV